MTRKQQIIQAANDFHDGVWQLAPVFVEGAEWADKHQPSPWISVKDRLPEDGVLVIAAIDNGDSTGILPASLKNGKWRFDITYNSHDGNKSASVEVALITTSVAFWMPIPEPPKGGEE